MFFNGKHYTKKEILSLVGDISQIGGLKKYEICEGKAKGMTVFDISNGNGLNFKIIPDRGLDISNCSFKSNPVAWISKTGEVASQFYEKDNLNWLRSFFGGFLTTCGLRNVGIPCECDGEDFGLHGRISNIPATNVSAKGYWCDDDYIIELNGDIRESRVFGENILLKRKISLKLGENNIKINDKIINEGFNDEQICILYHMNFGFPLVSENGRIVLQKGKIMPATDIAKEGLDTYSMLHKPVHNYKEQCFFVDFEDENVCVKIENDSLSDFKGISICYNKKDLPCFTIWKQLGESEYVVGLEPATTYPAGRNKIKENGHMVTLKPFEEKEINIEVKIDV